jgi:hypothetical protein
MYNRHMPTREAAKALLGPRWSLRDLECHPAAAGIFSDLEKRDGATFVPSFMRRTQIFARLLRLLGDLAATDGILLPSRTLYLCLLREVPIKTPALSIRRSALQRIGGFDERWTSSEDWEFLLRLVREHSLVYLDRPLAVIRVSPDSLRRGDQERGELAMLHLTRRRAAPPAPASSSGQNI